jgi:hypothetical protein
MEELGKSAEEVKNRVFYDLKFYQTYGHATKFRITSEDGRRIDSSYHTRTHIHTPSYTEGFGPVYLDDVLAEASFEELVKDLNIPILPIIDAVHDAILETILDSYKQNVNDLYGSIFDQRAKYVKEGR